MTDDTKALLKDILARCAQEAVLCLGQTKVKAHEYRAIDVRMAAQMAHASARLADSLGRLEKRAKKQTRKRGSNGQAPAADSDGPKNG